MYSVINHLEMYVFNKIILDAQLFYRAIFKTNLMNLEYKKYE